MLLLGSDRRAVGVSGTAYSVGEVRRSTTHYGRPRGPRRDLVSAPHRLPVAAVSPRLSAWPTVHGYFRDWRMSGVWVLLHRAPYPLARVAAGRKPDPTVVIMDGQSVKTVEQGGVRGFDGHKRVKGRKRHIMVDTLGLPIANRVEPANMSDRRAGGRLLAGLAPLWPTIRTVIADAGHESRKLARQLRRDGWNLKIVRRRQRAFKVSGLTDRKSTRLNSSQL